MNNHSYHASKLPVIQLCLDVFSLQQNDFAEPQLAPDTDYAALAEACGGAGRVVDSPQHMEEAIRWALAETGQGRYAVLDVRLPQP